MRSLATCVAVVATVLLPAVARAAPSSFHLPIAVDVGGGTYFPLSASAEVDVELPFRILLHGDVGAMPSAYSHMIVGALKDFAGIQPAEQELLETALQSSLVWRLAVGWRPIKVLGFELTGGVGMIAFGGSTGATSLVNTFLAEEGSTARVPENPSSTVQLGTSLDVWSAQLAYRVLFFHEHVVLRASLGYLQCFSSETSISATLPSSVPQPLSSRVRSQVEGYLGSYFDGYLKVPVAGLTLSYRF